MARPTRRQFIGFAALACVAIVLILLIVYRKPIYGSVCKTWMGIGMNLKRFCCEHHVISTCYGSEGGVVGRAKDVGCNSVWSVAEFKKNCKRTKK